MVTEGSIPQLLMAGAVEAGVGALGEQEGCDVGAGDAGADVVAAEVAGADGTGAGAVGWAGEARDRPVEASRISIFSIRLTPSPSFPVIGRGTA